MTYKDRLIAALETRRDVYASDSNIDRMRYMAEGLDAAITIARATRPDDVRPVVRGKWRQIGPKEAVCSVCNNVTLTNGIDRTGHANIHNALYHFCPNCGVDMRGENDE